jgi:hypothetical protein
MSLMTLLEQAQGGGLFANVARNLDLDVAQARGAMERLCPAIAASLRERAAADEGLFQSLLDLIEDGGQASPLDDPDGLTSPEAIADGNAILEDVYGSRNAAMVALRQAAETIPERELSKLAPLSATAVVAALAAANRPMALAASARPARGSAAGEGFIGALVSAIVAGIVAALVKQFTPRTRRRSTSYTRSRSRRKTTSSRTRTARRKTTTASVEDVFRDILGNLGK